MSLTPARPTATTILLSASERDRTTWYASPPASRWPPEKLSTRTHVANVMARWDGQAILPLLRMPDLPVPAKWKNARDASSFVVASLSVRSSAR